MTYSKENMHKVNPLLNQKGQTFLEFIFILVLLITISFSFMRGFNHLIGVRWELMLKIIARPNASEVVFP
jgi:hypothetical protein